MSGNGAQLDNQIRTMIQESKAIVDIHIRLNAATGEVEVRGPMSDPVLFLGMLETAKLTFSRMMARRREPPIVSPSPDTKEII